MASYNGYVNGYVTSFKYRMPIDLELHPEAYPLRT